MTGMIQPITGHELISADDGLVKLGKAGTKKQLSRKPSSFNDLSVLLMMVDSNMAATPMMELCIQARGLVLINAPQMEKATTPNKKSAHKETEIIFGEFLRALLNIMIWYIPEKYTSEVDKLLENYHHSVEGQ